MWPPAWGSGPPAQPLVVIAMVAVIAGVFAAIVVPHAAAWAVAGPAPARQPPRHRWLTRAPVAGALSALVAAALTWATGWSPLLPAVVHFALAAVTMAIVDLQHSRIPDRVALPAIGLGVVLLAIAAAVDQRWSALGSALVACVAGGGVTLVAHRAATRGVGGGDVTLVALVALYLGWHGWQTVVAGFVYGGGAAFVVAVTALLAGRGRHSSLPMAPPLLLGAVIALATTATG